jgi:hypothetical protein
LAWQQLECTFLFSRKALAYETSLHGKRNKRCKHLAGAFNWLGWDPQKSRSKNGIIISMACQKLRNLEKTYCTSPCDIP